VAGVATVPDGIYEIISKQAAGWGYIKVSIEFLIFSIFIKLIPEIRKRAESRHSPEIKTGLFVFLNPISSLRIDYRADNIVVIFL